MCYTCSCDIVYIFNHRLDFTKIYGCCVPTHNQGQKSSRKLPSKLMYMSWWQALKVLTHSLHGTFITLMYQFHLYNYFAVITAESYQILTKVFKIIVATSVQFFDTLRIWHTCFDTHKCVILTHPGFDTCVDVSNCGTSVWHIQVCHFDTLVLLWLALALTLYIHYYLSDLVCVVVELVRCFRCEVRLVHCPEC